MKINPDIVRRLRKAEGWSQERLGQEAKLDKTTISRLERGTHDDRRGTTASKLSKALRVDLKVLTGEEPIPEKRERRLFDNRSPITLSLDDAAYNALALAAARYRVEMVQILELAPFLFSWAAEASLRRRTEALSVLSDRMAAIEELQGQMTHVSSILGYSPLTEEVISEEERSILARDLFAECMRDSDTGNILKRDFEESDDGPIVVFLRGLAQEMPEATIFEDWSPRSAPNFKICEAEATALFDGDGEITDAVLRGAVALSRMPNDLRLKGKSAQRLEWARQEHAAHQERVASELRALGLDLDDLLKKSGTEAAS